ncbi:hypothetical protein MKX53_17530 [Psychrobacillus sp. FSL K6-4615]|uniref:hypothetical protein n=1 Tax=Psychrobacillus sp. FSL K6-4615 TaxID=2921551 RepID=UPI0030F99A69
MTNFMDIKTILTVLGTVFGAYFGAKTAGKFAIASVEKQIESNNAMEMEKRVKTVRIIRSELYVFKTYLERFLKLKKEDTSLSTLFYLSQNVLKPRGIKLENTLEKVDWMYIPEKEFMLMIITKELVDNILYDLNNINLKTQLENKEETFLELWKTSERWYSELEEFNKIYLQLELYN